MKFTDAVVPALAALSIASASAAPDAAMAVLRGKESRRLRISVEKSNKKKLEKRVAALEVLVEAQQEDIDALKAAQNQDGPMYYARIATFPVCKQLDPTCDTDDETVAEIVVATEDGNTLVYTDAETGSLGFIDITDPLNPMALNLVALSGEPTSVAVKGTYAFVGINTSPDFVNPSGNLKVLDISDPADPLLITTIDLGGQPDSVAVSPDGNYVAIAIENERDEDLGDGGIPQLPAGYLSVVDISDSNPATWLAVMVNLTGLPNVYEPSDPEPEYVSINDDNVAVVTLQENNAIVLVDLESLTVLTSVSAGSTDLTNIDVVEEGVINQSASQPGRLAEPDGVTWMGNEYFATADEGDLFGGSRGFSVFRYTAPDHVERVYVSGNEIEHIVASVGHYPEERSENKGNEPEGVTYDAEHQLLSVLSERAGVVLVYDVSNPVDPVFHQVLPANVGPEGGVYIKKRGLLAIASEKDDRGDKIRSAVAIYRYGLSAPSYPTLASQIPGDGSAPIGWGAQSGLSPCLAEGSSVLYSVEDSFYSKNRIFTIDSTTTPPTITKATRIVDSMGVLAVLEPQGEFDAADLAALINADGTVNIDPEGVVAYSDGEDFMGWWVAHEGHGTVGDEDSPVESLNMLLLVDIEGVIHRVVTLPEHINAIQLRFGFEGVTAWGNKLVVSFQRAWGAEPGPRIGVYDILTNAWTFYFYPLEAPASQNGGWVGLSDIHSLGDGKFLVLERDNQGGPDAAIKIISLIDLSGLADGDTVTKTVISDILPNLSTAIGGLTIEKVEGLTMSNVGDVWISTDNDGVDDNSGETQLINLGNIALLMGNGLDGLLLNQ